MDERDVKEKTESDNGAKAEASLPVSRMVVTFVTPGSAEFTFHLENVTPAQMIGCAAWLDWYARHQFDLHAMNQMASAPKLIIPGAMPQRKM